MLADGGAGGSAPAPRKRSKAAAQVAHDLQQQPQQEGYEPARLAQQVSLYLSRAITMASAHLELLRLPQACARSSGQPCTAAAALGYNSVIRQCDCFCCPAYCKIQKCCVEGAQSV